MVYKHFIFPQSASIIIYFIIILSSVYCIYIADKKNDSKNSYKYLLAAYIIISIPSVIRYCVGNDYEPFLELIDFYKKYDTIIRAKRAHDIDYSFIILAKLFVNHPIVVFAFYSLLTQLFMIKGIWNFRKEVSPTMIMFLYMTSFYLRTYNIFRQSLAIAIIFYAIKFIRAKNLKKYIMFVAFATIVHKTAVICIVLYFWFMPSPISEAIRKVLSFSWPIIVVLLTDSVLERLYGVLPIFSSYASVYKVGEAESIFTMGSFLQLFIWGLYIYNRKKLAHNKSEFTLSIIDKAMLAQVFFHFMSFKISHVARIGLYFNFYFYIGLASLHKKGNQISVRRMTFNEAFLILYGIYQFTAILMSNRFTSLPYSIWLQF